ncbi:phosphatase PAP2 family protein [Bacillus sp. SM2101]|uniref:phosphatase PAP2 family protein n=1 Tax=Bacillus sp. SM2101 TaxID=2805366 RepID=UPI001BDE69F5|nr:phosphatase PAP2 family protein [Bacillus sp. SM2101]
MEINRQPTETAKRPVLYHIGFIALCLISVAIFLIIAEVIQQSGKVAFDTVIRDIFVLESQSFVYQLFKDITWLGNKPGVITMLVIMLVWLIWRYRDFKGIILLITMVILQNEFNKVLKDFYQRERPLIDPAIDALGYSFPSGHAMTGLLAYGLATYLIVVNVTSFKAKLFVGIFGSILIFLIGLSRIILSAHYPTDVIAGHALGIVTLIISIYLYQWMKKKNFSKKNDKDTLQVT